LVPPGQALEASRAGAAVIVDLRDSKLFDPAHPPGALNVPYSTRGLGSRVSDLVGAIYDDPARQVILIAANDEMAAQALEQFNEASIATMGVVAGGMPAWQDAGLPTDSLEEIDVDQLAPGSRPQGLVTLDVREPIEWEMGHVPGALLISLGELAQRVAEVSVDQPIAIICEAGIRSAMAASILRAKGHMNVLHAADGTAAYRAAGLPMEYTQTPD
jgi:hydroxyacylglutathione hydrolase